MLLLIDTATESRASLIILFMSEFNKLLITSLVSSICTFFLLPFDCGSSSLVGSDLWYQPNMGSSWDAGSGRTIDGCAKCDAGSAKQANMTTSVRSCRLEFIEYVSSPMELFWLTNIDAIYKNDLCGAMSTDEFKQQSSVWVATSSKSQRGEPLHLSKSDPLFSYFKRKVVCTDCIGFETEEIVYDFIEPLAGLFFDYLFVHSVKSLYKAHFAILALSVTIPAIFIS